MAEVTADVRRMMAVGSILGISGVVVSVITGAGAALMVLYLGITLLALTLWLLISLLLIHQYKKENERLLERIALAECTKMNY